MPSSLGHGPSIDFLKRARFADRFVRNVAGLQNDGGLLKLTLALLLRLTGGGASAELTMPDAAVDLSGGVAGQIPAVQPDGSIVLQTFQSVCHQVDCSGGTSDTYGALSGTINGSNKTFTVSKSKYISSTLKVYLNGQLQTQGTAEDWKENTPASGTFDFITAPVSGDVILVEYDYSSASSTLDADTVDGVHATGFVQKTAGSLASNEILYGTGAESADSASTLKRNSSGDILPISATVGLEQRMRWLFGTNNPAHVYRFSWRSFYTDNFAGHVAGFNVGANPFSFGGTPGGFAISIPGGATAETNTYSHHLWMYNPTGTPEYISWTDATGKHTMEAHLSVNGYMEGAAADVLLFEMRFWGVQSPGAADKYWSVRYVWDNTNSRVDIKLYYGTGVTFSPTDGTNYAKRVLYIPGTHHKYVLGVMDVGGTPVFAPNMFLDEGMDGMIAYHGQAGYPTIIKTAYLYIPASSNGDVKLDDVVFY